jgi:hypothetical protein
MTVRGDPAEAAPRHAPNALCTEILGAADLALHHPCGPFVRSELETVAPPAQEGGALVRPVGAR